MSNAAPKCPTCHSTRNIQSVMIKGKRFWYCTNCRKTV